jgi:hypothetical protein
VTLKSMERPRRWARARPVADLPCEGEQHGGKAEQHRHQRLEQPFWRRQQKQRADAGADHAGRHHADEGAIKRRQLLAVRKRCEKRAGDGGGQIADGGRQRRQAGGDQRRISDHGGAADHRRDDAAGDAGRKQHQDDMQRHAGSEIPMRRSSPGPAPRQAIRKMPECRSARAPESTHGCHACPHRC